MFRLLLVVLLVAACSPRGELAFVPPGAVPGDLRSVFVGTTRSTDGVTGRFDGNRSEATSYARYDVSVPPDRALGVITWPKRGRPVNAQTDFLTLAEVRHADASGFRADLAEALARDRRGMREAVIYVHGFNNTFSEGLYRIAQLSHDLEMPGVAVHYSWPSAGNPLGYVQDRDSALFARDGLERLMDEVVAAGADRVFLVAHSMGSALTMETLRQIAIRGNTRVRNRISGVLLISPDIDVDVFRMQARSIGTLPDPFLIFGSARDRTLSLSARLTGQPQRLGNLQDITRVADLRVTYLDTAAFDSGAGHFNLGNSGALLRLLSRIGDVDAAFSADRTGRTGLLPGIVLTVQEATEIILLPVTVLADEIGN